MNLRTNARSYLGHVEDRFGKTTTRLWRVEVAFVLVLATIFTVVLPTEVASAATDTVTTCSGDASTPGSLPYEVANATSGDTITFSVACPASSPIVVGSPIEIGVNLTINGPGAGAVDVSGTTADDPVPNTDLFEVEPGIVTAISGVTIDNGVGISDLSAGGINNYGTLTVSDSVLTDNVGDAAGGIYNTGALTITSSLLSRNAVPGFGVEDGAGAVDNDGGTVTIVDSTVSKNEPALDFGGLVNNNGSMTVSGTTLVGNVGGVENDDGTLSITNSTVVGNEYVGILNDEGTTTVTATTVSSNKYDGTNIENENGIVSLAGTIVAKGGSRGDCTGDITDAGYNLDDDDSCGFLATHHSQSGVRADLGPLQNNGGPTSTLAPALDSPAINQIPLGTSGNGVSLCPGVDQRGVTRPQGSQCTVGAVEVAGHLTITKVKPASGKVGKKVTIEGTELSGATQVSFNGKSASITTDTVSEITTVVPAGATTGPISVTTSVGGTVTSTKSFKVT
jgi:hypothetical protein